MTAILSSSFLQFIILREMEYITGRMNGALLELRGTLENAQKEEWKKYLNSQLCAYDCAPTIVRLRLCAYDCAPTSARLRVRAYAAHMQHIRIVDASKGSYREVLRLFDWKSFRGSD